MSWQPTDKWIITDIYSAWYLKSDGSWSHELPEAEDVPSEAAAVQKSAERHNRYPHRLIEPGKEAK
jgi:hypothetical protein